MRLFNPPRVVRRIFASMVVALAAAGCGSTSPSAAVGTYSRADGPLVERITLNSDGTFDQVVAYADGQTFKLSDTWTLNNRQVQFSRLYITRELMTAKVLKPPELRHYANMLWHGGVLVKDPEQGYVFRVEQQAPP